MTLNLELVKKIIKESLLEDIGSGDITSNLTIDADSNTAFSIRAREELVVCGTNIAKMVFAELNKDIRIYDNFSEGDVIEPGEIILSGYGNSRAIFAAERVALNLLRVTCGTASITRKFVEQIAATKAQILDTRKTIPLLREIQKYAVRIGGGKNHRLRLDDAILIKDNHIKASGSVSNAITKALFAKEKVKFIEVECDNLKQVAECLNYNIDIIMLDNMSIEEINEAVAMVKGKVKLEVSGNVNLDNVLEIANSGVDYIAIGMITHSTPNVDIGLDID